MEFLKRQSGYYWVRSEKIPFNGSWFIACWSEHTLSWTTDGVDCSVPMNDPDFTEINENRILPPIKKITWKDTDGTTGGITAQVVAVIVANVMAAYLIMWALSAHKWQTKDYHSGMMRLHEQLHTRNRRSRR